MSKQSVPVFLFTFFSFRGRLAKGTKVQPGLIRSKTNAGVKGSYGNRIAGYVFISSGLVCLSYVPYNLYLKSEELDVPIVNLVEQAFSTKYDFIQTHIGSSLVDLPPFGKNEFDVRPTPSQTIRRADLNQIQSNNTPFAIPQEPELEYEVPDRVSVAIIPEEKYDSNEVISEIPNIQPVPVQEIRDFESLTKDLPPLRENIIIDSEPNTLPIYNEPNALPVYNEIVPNIQPEQKNDEGVKDLTVKSTSKKSTDQPIIELKAEPINELDVVPEPNFEDQTVNEASYEELVDQPKETDIEELSSKKHKHKKGKKHSKKHKHHKK